MLCSVKSSALGTLAGNAPALAALLTEAPDKQGHLILLNCSHSTGVWLTSRSSQTLECGSVSSFFNVLSSLGCLGTSSPSFRGVL